MTELLRAFKGRLAPYTDGERRRIMGAARWAGRLHQDQRRDSGEPYVTHPLAVAEILAGLKMDDTTLISALLHDVLEDTAVTEAGLREDILNKYSLKS